MDKLKVFTKLLGASLVLSYLTLFLPQSSGTVVGTFDNRQTQTIEFIREVYASGFPLKFYIPAGSDYGANFMMESFIANTIVIFVFILLTYFATRKLIQKAGI